MSSRASGQSRPESRDGARAPADGGWPFIALAVTPIWGFLALSRVLFYAIERMRYPDLVPPVSTDALQGTLLLPFVILGGWAVLAAWRRWNRVAGIATLIVSASLFASAARPVYGVAMWMLGNGDATTSWFHFMNPSAPGFWYMWLANAVEYAVLYISCVTAAIGLLAYRSLSRERALRAEMEMRATRERLRALRTQINPHFLFNTLNIIASMETARSPALTGAIARLGEFLQRSLAAAEDEEHSIAAELACISSYLQIEAMRHPDRIASHVQVEPHCTGQIVPTLILLPLVENAVKHGLRSPHSRVLVEVRARLASGILELTVRNPCDTRPPTQPRHSDGGRGLRLVQDRLAMHFNGRATLDAGSARPGEYVVLVRMPVDDDEEPVITWENGACSEPKFRVPSLFGSRDSVCRTYRTGTTVRLGRKRAGESWALRVLKYLVLKFEANSILLRSGGSQCTTTFL